MKSYSVEAYVLRMRPLGEADRILTLFSAERGKLSAVAKGARKTRSKFGARLDFMARSQLTLHVGRSLDVITGARLVGGAWEHVIDPDVFALASYLAETIDGLCEPELAVPEIYEILRQFEQTLKTSAAITGPESASSSESRFGAMRVVIDLRLLSALGFAPELDACVRCGEPLGRRPFAGGRAALSPEAGGLVCRRCLDAGSGDEGDMRRSFGVVRLSTAEFQLLRAARVLSLQEAAGMPALASLGRATQAFIQQHLGRAAKSLAAVGARAQR